MKFELLSLFGQNFIFFQMQSVDKPFESRISQFKNRSEMKGDEMRRRREDVTVEIRKQKREESLAKRRNFIPLVNEDSDSDQEGVAPSPSNVIRFDFRQLFTSNFLK